MNEDRNKQLEERSRKDREEAGRRGLAKEKKEMGGVNTSAPPWLDVRLPEEAMNFLWDIIEQSPTEEANTTLAGNISKSEYILDKDNYFFEKVLKECSECLYYRDWISYFNVNIAKVSPTPVFELAEMWVNYQKQHEFQPPHQHGGIYSFVVFMKIPTHWKEQHNLPMTINSRIPSASNFQFLMNGEGRWQTGEKKGVVKTAEFQLSPEDEGRMLFFPSWLQHQVFPFYECEEDRITLSGNLYMEKSEITQEREKNRQETEGWKNKTGYDAY